MRYNVLRLAEICIAVQCFIVRGICIAVQCFTVGGDLHCSTVFYSSGALLLVLTPQVKR